MHKIKASSVKKVLGQWGEELACAYLEARGYQIIERNFTIQGGEIDIVAQTGDNLVIVEVKTRTNTAYGGGIEAITAAKLRTLRRTIMHYQSLRQWYGCYVRCDLVVIQKYGDSGRIEYEHIENILSG